MIINIRSVEEICKIVPSRFYVRGNDICCVLIEGLRSVYNKKGK